MPKISVLFFHCSSFCTYHSERRIFSTSESTDATLDNTWKLWLQPWWCLTCVHRFCISSPVIPPYLHSLRLHRTAWEGGLLWDNWIWPQKQSDAKWGRCPRQWFDWLCCFGVSVLMFNWVCRANIAIMPFEIQVSITVRIYLKILGTAVSKQKPASCRVSR